MKFKYQNHPSSICLKDQVLKEGFDPAYGARLGPWALGPLVPGHPRTLVVFPLVALVPLVPHLNTKLLAFSSFIMMFITMVIVLVI